MAAIPPTTECIPFSELMTLEKVDSISEDTSTTASFMGKHKSPYLGAYSGGYGGFVYAQSVWAAAQTVAKNMIVHVSRVRDCLQHTYNLLERTWLFHLTSVYRQTDIL